MDPIIISLVLMCLSICALAALPAWRKKSWKRFLLGILLSFFGVLLPLVFFFFSALLVPDSKPNCHFGWLDCFHWGKLALTPLVLWATAALYVVEVCDTPRRTLPWIVLGFFTGAIVSTLCVIYGIITGDRASFVLLIVPIYTAVWYVLRAVQLIRLAKPSVSSLVFTIVGSLPFWAVSLVWSYGKYFSLPDQLPPDCFIVTAASRGHREFVGPFLEVPHRGQMRLANRQLATFWQLESVWRDHSPRSHAAFRRVYNQIGPIIARNISSPFLADAVFLALKPFEFFARVLLNLGKLRRQFLSVKS